MSACVGEAETFTGSAMSGENGWYQYDIVDLLGEYAVGDEILVQAVKGVSFSGSANGAVTSAFFDAITATLDIVISGFSMVMAPSEYPVPVRNRVNEEQNAEARMLPEQRKSFIAPSKLMMKRGEDQNMNRRMKSGAMLMCATFMLIAAAPFVQSSEDGTVHTILKDENGPPSTCALDWWITPEVDGTWHGAVTNYGMRWLIIDVVDESTGDVLIDREMYRYAVWGNEFDTDSVHMVAGHTYGIRGTPNGPLWTFVEVEDVFVPDQQPPVAAFTYSVDGLTVSVDASLSNDPDGTIVAYDWDWGDGSSDTGVTAEHTYEPPVGGVWEFAASSPVLGIEFPHPVTGVTYDSEGNPLPDCEVTVTDVTLGESATVMSDASGLYQYDIANLPGEYSVGDELLVEAVKGPLSGSATGVVSDGFFTLIDVTLEGETPEPFDVTITLTVTDDDGLTSTWSETVTLQP